MYEEHWGLTDRPFQLTPDPRFWFETATHRKAMAYLGYGLQQGEGFVVVTGEVGAGKTTLIAHLLEQVDPADLHVVRLVSTAIDPADLLRSVAMQLGIDTAGLEKAQLLTAIERGLHAVARTGRRTLLVVDEAQALPVGSLEELRMLSNFQAGGHAMLQIVLVGQPEFRDRLNGAGALEQLRQRVIAIHHLDSMGEDEVADYIAHRLALVGWHGRPDFASDAFEALHGASGGIPRRLNLVANRVLLQAAVAGEDLIDAAMIDAVEADMAADLPVHTAGRLPAEKLGATREQLGSPLPFRGGVGGEASDPDATLVSTPHANPFPEGEGLGSIEAVASCSDPAADDEHSPTGAPANLAPAPIVAPAHESATAFDTRIAELEARLEAQDAALRRVLTLLVDWVEADPAAAPRARAA